MARVLVKQHAWGFVWEKAVDRVVSVPVAGVLATIDTDVYTAASGGTIIDPGDFVTDADGYLPGYVEVGEYSLTVDGGAAFAVVAGGGAGGGSYAPIELVDADFNNIESDRGEGIAGWRVQPGGTSGPGLESACSLTRSGAIVSWRGRIEWLAPIAADDTTGFVPDVVLTTGTIPADWLPTDEVWALGNSWRDQVDAGDHGSHLWQFFVVPYSGGSIRCEQQTLGADRAPHMGEMLEEATGAEEIAEVYVNISWHVAA
jgi:hypothetical protein